MCACTAERLEAGTLNAPAFAGLEKACGESEFRFDDLTLLNKELVNGLNDISGITIYGAPENDFETYVPTALINKEGMTPDALSDLLRIHGFCVRSGLHCSPSAHAKLGTLEKGGGVRISLGKNNRRSQIKRLLKILDI